MSDWLRQRALPVATVVAGLVVVWYVAAAFMNAPMVRAGFERSDTRYTLAELVAGTMAEERPVLPAPHQVVAGFVDSVGVDDKNQRDAKEYPRDHWTTRVDPLFGPAWSSDVRLAIEGPSGWVLNGCGVEESNQSARAFSLP